MASVTPPFSALSIQEKAGFLHSVMASFAPRAVGGAVTAVRPSSDGGEKETVHREVRRLVALARKQKDPESFEGICDSIRRSLQNSETLTDSIIDAMSNRAKILTNIPEHALREVVAALRESLEPCSSTSKDQSRALLPRAMAARCALRLMSSGVWAVDSFLCELCIAGVTSLADAQLKTEKKGSSSKESAICILEFFKDLATLVQTQASHISSHESLAILTIEACVQGLRNGFGTKSDLASPFAGDIIAGLYWERRELASAILRQLVDLAAHSRAKVTVSGTTVGAPAFILLRVMQYKRAAPSDLAAGSSSVSLRMDSEELSQTIIEDISVTASDVAALCDLKPQSKLLIGALPWLKAITDAEACVMEFLSWVLQIFKTKEKDEIDVSSLLGHLADDLIVLCQSPDYPAADTALVGLAQFCVATAKSPELSDNEKGDKWRSAAFDSLAKVVVGVAKFAKKLKEEHTVSPSFDEQSLHDMARIGDATVVQYSLSQLCTFTARRVKEEHQRESAKKPKERDHIDWKAASFLSLHRQAVAALTAMADPGKIGEEKLSRLMWARSAAPESILHKDRATVLIKFALDAASDFPNLKHRIVRHLAAFVGVEPSVFAAAGPVIVTALGDSSHLVRSAALSALQQITGGAWEGEDQILELSASVSPLQHQQLRVLQQLVSGVCELLNDTVPAVVRAALALLSAWLRGSSLTQFPDLRMRACWKMLAVFTRTKDDTVKTTIVDWCIKEWVGKTITVDGKEKFVPADIEVTVEELTTLMQNCHVASNSVDAELLSFPGMFRYMHDDLQDTNSLVGIWEAILGRVPEERLLSVAREVASGLPAALAGGTAWPEAALTARTTLSTAQVRPRCVARIALLSTLGQARPALLAPAVTILLGCLQPVAMIGNEVRSPVLYHALSCFVQLCGAGLVEEVQLEEVAKYSLKLLKEYQDLSRVLTKLMHGCCECIGAALLSLDEKKAKGFAGALLPVGDLVVRGMRTVVEAAAPAAASGANARLLVIMCSIVKTISLYKYHGAFKAAVKDARRPPADQLTVLCGQSTGLVGNCLETLNKALRQRKTPYKNQLQLEPYVAKAIMGILGHAPLSHAQIIIKELNDWLTECCVPAQVELLFGIRDFVLLECETVSTAQQKQSTEARTAEFATVIVNSVHRGVAQCVVSPSAEVRRAATELVDSIIRNRFSPPILFVEAIVIGTSIPDTAPLAASVLNVVQGIDTHIVLNVDVMTCAYKHQSEQGAVPRGFVVPPAGLPVSVVAPLFTTFKAHKHASVCRKSVDTFIQSALRKAVSLQPLCTASNQHAHVVQFVRFVVESIASLPYEFADEVLFVVNSIDSHVNVHGEECLRDLFPHVSEYLPEATRKQHAPAGGAGSKGTHTTSKMIAQISERAYSVIALLLLKGFLKSDFDLTDTQVQRYKETFENHSLNKKNKLKIDEEKNFAVGQRTRSDINRSSQREVETSINSGKVFSMPAIWSKFESTLSNLMDVAAGNDMRAIAGLLYMTLNSHLQVELVAWKEGKGAPKKVAPKAQPKQSKKRSKAEAESDNEKSSSSSESSSSGSTSDSESEPPPKKSKAAPGKAPPKKR